MGGSTVLELTRKQEEGLKLAVARYLWTIDELNLEKKEEVDLEFDA